MVRKVFRSSVGFGGRQEQETHANARAGTAWPRGMCMLEVCCSGSDWQAAMTMSPSGESTHAPHTLSTLAKLS